MIEKATLRILSVESVRSETPGATDSEAVCVVRCTEGTAWLGMVFHRLAPQSQSLPAEAPLTLSSIEWYGKQADQLDTVHSGEVILTGAGADELATWDVLYSTPDVRREE
ncbi:hypothetical protein GCM10010406_08240 [Streptomyces thermolineatus]|uniref:Uncharacterized protein n=1 Tax=Streptomyces thermolineatus TaxID=44033 RepID=A0ABP5Y443_9ACTN